MKKTSNKKAIIDVCMVGILIALGVVLSAFLQIPLFGDIRADLSYVVIIYACYAYGSLKGGFVAMTIAMMESTLFTSYGFSISWAVANLVLGLLIGLSFELTKNLKAKRYVYYVINISVIVCAVAIGMLGFKTMIECLLYSIPFEVKIVKNLVAFALDCTVSLIGFCIVLPKIIKDKKNQDVVEKETEQ